MKGVKFGNFHSYDTWGLILSSKEIQSPSPKINHVEIEGGDGVLDYTEYFGDVKFNNRTLTFNFSAWKNSQEDFLKLYSTIHNAIHGKKMKVILDDDPEFYYFGRVKVNEWKSNKKIGEIVIEVDAEPYKMKNELTSVSVTVDGKTNNLYNVNDVESSTIHVSLSNDDFVVYDLFNELPTFYAFRFSNPISELQAGTNYKVVFEFFSEEDLSGNISFRWESKVGSSIDQFSESIRNYLSGYVHEVLTFTKKTKPIEEFENANVSVRYMMHLIGKTSGKLRIRVSVLPESAETENFIYTSHDGLMKGFYLSNIRKKAIPTIKATAPCTLLFEGNSFAIDAGTYTIPEIELKQGINYIAVQGLATVTFLYREGGI